MAMRASGEPRRGAGTVTIWPSRRTDVSFGVSLSSSYHHSRHDHDHSRVGSNWKRPSSSLVRSSVLADLGCVPGSVGAGLSGLVSLPPVRLSSVEQPPAL